MVDDFQAIAADKDTTAGAAVTSEFERSGEAKHDFKIIIFLQPLELLSLWASQLSPQLLPSPDLTWCTNRYHVLKVLSTLSTILHKYWKTLQQ